jgi:hypothetical protein
MRSRVAATFAAPVFLESPCDVRRYAGVDRAISALEEIDVVHIEIV